MSLVDMEHPVLRCKCEKIKFATKEEANQFAREAARNGGVKQRAYDCEEGVWHLTSQSVSHARQTRKRQVRAAKRAAERAARYAPPEESP